MDNSGQDGQLARLNEFLAGVNISRQYLKIKNIFALLTCRKLLSIFGGSISNFDFV